MKKITKTEFEALDKYSVNKKVMDKVKTLEVSEGLQIEFSEWKTKTPPDGYIGQIYRRSRSNKIFKVRKINTGWIILRIK